MHHRKIGAALVVLLLLTSCASLSGVTPLQKAELAYAEASIGYEVAQGVIVSARSQHLINDQTWAAFDNVQIAVQSTAPQVRKMLTTWQSTGVKPDGFDTVMALLSSAAQAATKIQQGVSKP